MGQQFFEMPGVLDPEIFLNQELVVPEKLSGQGVGINGENKTADQKEMFPMGLHVPFVSVRLLPKIHPTMASWAGLVENPFFAVTDDEGKFSIKGLPPGKHTLAVWQEGWTTKDEKGREREVEVKAGETKKVDFSLDLKKGP